MQATEDWLQPPSPSQFPTLACVLSEQEGAPQGSPAWVLHDPPPTSQNAVLAQDTSAHVVWQQMSLVPLLMQTPFAHSLGDEQEAPSIFFPVQLPPEQYCPVPHGTGVFAWHPPEPSHAEVITDVPSTLQEAVPHVSPAWVLHDPPPTAQSAVLAQDTSAHVVWQQMLLVPLLIQTPFAHSPGNEQEAPSIFLVVQVLPEQ